MERKVNFCNHFNKYISRLFKNNSEMVDFVRFWTKRFCI